MYILKVYEGRYLGGLMADGSSSKKIKVKIICSCVSYYIVVQGKSRINTIAGYIRKAVYSKAHINSQLKALS